jgi:hypothetical protein
MKGFVIPFGCSDRTVDFGIISEKVREQILKQQKNIVLQNREKVVQKDKISYGQSLVNQRRLKDVERENLKEQIIENVRKQRLASIDKQKNTITLEKLRNLNDHKSLFLDNENMHSNMEELLGIEASLTREDILESPYPNKMQ